MKLWLATTLAAILFAVCNAKAFLPFNNYEQEVDDQANFNMYSSPYVNMEQADKTPDAKVDETPSIDANMELVDKTPDQDIDAKVDETPSIDANMEQVYDTPNIDAITEKFPEAEAICSRTCLHYLYILAFTSGKRNAGSDKAHEVEVRAAGQTKVIKLPNRPGDDFKKNKGDFWKLTFTKDLKFTRCVTLKNLDHVAIDSGSNDGWNIDSIATYVGATGRGFKELTHDFDVFRWIDGNGKTSHRRFMLTKV